MNLIPIDQFYFNNDSIFDNLSEGELELLNSRMVTLKYKQGQIIFQEGGLPLGIFIVKQGKVKKYKTGIDGKEQIFYVCKEKELIGYHALLSEEYYSDSAATMEDSIISMIPKDDFLKVLNISSVLSNHLLKNLSHEFSVLINSIAIQSQKSVRERLALALLILKDKYKENIVNDIIHITLSRDDLAGIVGTAKETLVRLLHNFKDESLIRTEGRAIIILDTKGLAKVANFK
ncbi:MAG: Crp/Fnr family transcriptional regulator [Sporocytophaga sp.]|uniref:Crp/Fnr family transcriptional regulator n=1 Tax=Sporocytophaga sp. TaxID=2231183 RepID=UPI001B2AA019|nr:Crp/Fnr family transcriptional regulator [Sporocytophaga sp.]MBO9701960.1 Crp/Fnr family transcriptional regulator [Sporocytophaga sp.]